jgi:hypothetical protein
VAILPLHIEDRLFVDGEPVFGSYFRSLAFVITSYLAKDRSLVPLVFRKILGMWPKANSKKVS